MQAQGYRIRDPTQMEPVEAAPASLTLTLVSAFGGVAFTVVAGLIGALIQGRREHAKWQRDQRLKAYGEFLAATDNYLGGAVRQDEEGLPDIVSASLTASAIIRLLGPDDVYAAALRLQRATQATVQAFENGDELGSLEEERTDARDAFIGIARRKVKVRG